MNICIVSAGRSDRQLYKPIERALGDHCYMLEMENELIGPVALQMGTIIEGVHGQFQQERPDIVLLLGDRYEMFCAAVAATANKLPIAHIHGGETTGGSFDEQWRHAITKMAHLHFASTALHGNRIIRMGEHPDRVFFSGAPGIDNIVAEPECTDKELSERLGIEVLDRDPPILVTLHPETTGSGDTEEQASIVLRALSNVGRPVVVTDPNNDPGNDKIRKVLCTQEEFWQVPSLGANYVNMMRHAYCMVGNSSSGIIEACSTGLPVVNVGGRQLGRTRGPNVIDVPFRVDSIMDAIEQCEDLEFKVADNPYGSGNTGRFIADKLLMTEINDELMMKTFYDMETEVV